MSLSGGPPVRIISLLPFVTFLLLSGCLGRTPPVRYYSLEPLTVSGPEFSLPGEISVVIGPVSIPDLLNRPQIISRNSQTGVQVSQFNRWTEPLQREIAAILAENIGALTNSSRIIPYTQENLFQPQYRLVVHIDRLEGQPSEGMRLETTWSIKETKSGDTLLMRRSFFQEPLASDSCDELVQAYSKVLAAFSRELVRELSKNIITK